MTEHDMIRHCAPTLAGIKTGSIFTCPYASKAALLADMRKMNTRLSGKGLRAVPLRFSGQKALIYVYRPSLLSSDLADDDAAALLRRHGYDLRSSQRCVAQLAQRLRQQGDFPHEIGLFLGYPPEDVWGFIENQAAGCKCVGCWKVYGDEAAARKKFEQYKKCTRVYCDQWARGCGIERLTVVC